MQPGHPVRRRLLPALAAVTLLATTPTFGALADPQTPWAAPIGDAPAPDAQPPADAPPPEDLPPPPPEDAPAPPAEDGPPPPPPEDLPAPPPEDGPPPPEPMMAAPDQLLTADVASEQGMQVDTILLARSITAAFPQITTMVGVRPDSQPWHPSGRAVDVMIPNPGSPEGIALGDQIVDYALRNAGRFGLQDAIWRGTYFTPGSGNRGGYGHYDHVHLTTFGGGRPTGGEQFLRVE